ncbi:nonsense-mediated mRNA decay factor SMG5 [Prorops nasuta]|uniref:nonsense-mediated mRNA decay factor SMG5 n=1 Tax=Prorops nasuta TaxID=863751 RepID=UPI0034CF36E3
MKKNYSAVLDTRATDTLELTRRWHRSITDIAKKLDVEKSHALTISDLFTPSSEALRRKLKDYCERLIFKDPIGNVRKTEELLWRRGFYDVVHAAKKLRKVNTWNDHEKGLLSIHLAVGIGFYHHLILKLQTEFGLDLIGIIDFAFTQNETNLLSAKSKVTQVKASTIEIQQCLMRLIHRSLVCLGDLARYKLTLDPNWDPMIAKRYYKMAIAIDPNIGMPHNQLGTIAGNRNYGLDAVYHYMRCLLCSESFEGVEGNLEKAIATHSTCSDDKPSIYHCISRLLSLIQLWDLDIRNSDKINQECQDLLNYIETCLVMSSDNSDNNDNFENADSIETFLQKAKCEETFLTSDIVFKIMAICLMSIARLKAKESSEVPGVIAITLAILSQLVQFLLTKLQESIIGMSLSNVEGKINSNAIVNNSNNNDEGIKSTSQHEDENCIITEIISVSEINELQDNKTSTDDNKNIGLQQTTCNDFKKAKDKSKNLLTKLRRPRKRTSSDSDGSDIDGAITGSSSDEMNSDISETEEDALSDENILSDDAISEDGTDDEGLPKVSNNKINNVGEKVNGQFNLEKKNKKSDIPNKGNVEDQVNTNKYDLNSDNKDLTINCDSVIPTPTNVESNSTYDETIESANTIEYEAQLKKESLKPNEVLCLLEKECFFSSIKICFDWLKSNQDVIRMCVKSSRILLKRIITLLNLINISIEEAIISWGVDTTIVTSVEKLKEFVNSTPLPEDVDLKGFNLLNEAHKSLKWTILHKCKMSSHEETLLRTLKLIEFGRHLCSLEHTGIKYDEEKRQFTITDLKDFQVVKDKDMDNKDLETDRTKGKLMRHMGRLWLKAEVRALESRLRSRLISPYLVPDHEALAKHTPALKRLVYAKKFIIVIPSVVVSALDEVKRTSSKAREATRWLEAQLRRGSRFLRAQRPHERLALPFIKGPRPKDKEAWLFFQIIECCHYLTQQTKVGLTSDAEPPVVTLLTGCGLEDRKSLTFSPDGLARSAGVNIEHIESFHTKWKSSSKSHG